MGAMVTANTPPLSAQTWESIETEIAAIHVQYRQRLRPLSIGQGGLAMLAAMQHAIPRDPVFLFRTGSPLGDSLAWPPTPGSTSHA
jgi:hypothetical protein